MITETLAAALLAYAAAATGLDMPDTLPEFRYGSQQQLNAMHFGERYEGPANVGALFEHDAAGLRRIWLKDGWRANDLHDRARVVHELTHYLQAENGEPLSGNPCQADSEAEAWGVMIAYVDDHTDVDPYDVLGVTPGWVERLTVCPWGLP